MTRASRFDVTPAELDLIAKIADRAEAAGWSQGSTNPDHWYKRGTLVLDMIVMTANGCPMDFERMLDADDFNFLHDLSGIARHMDRETGRLTGGFLPRFAKPEAERVVA